MKTFGAYRCTYARQRSRRENIIIWPRARGFYCLLYTRGVLIRAYSRCYLLPLSLHARVSLFLEGEARAVSPRNTRKRSGVPVSLCGKSEKCRGCLFKKRNITWGRSVKYGDSTLARVSFLFFFLLFFYCISAGALDILLRVRTFLPLVASSSFWRGRIISGRWEFAHFYRLAFGISLRSSVFR